MTDRIGPIRCLYLVEDAAQLEEYRAFASAARPRMESYLDFLRQQYQVTQLPEAIFWTDRHTATHLLSDIPAPAYTNEKRTVFTPCLDCWRQIYKSQLEGISWPDSQQPIVRALEQYYETQLEPVHLLQILGHEFAHHSPLFLMGFEDAREKGVWFEEGMVEYISRTYFLPPQQYQAEKQANRQLVELLTPYYGQHPLEDFGAETYAGSFGSIFFEYWRSFLAVDALVQRFGGTEQVFRLYHDWARAGASSTLEEWFAQHP